MAANSYILGNKKPPGFVIFSKSNESALRALSAALRNDSEQAQWFRRGGFRSKKSNLR